jgi:hypothetical protein
MFAGWQCSLKPFQLSLQDSFQKAFSHKTSLCGGRRMAYARFQANNPRSWAAASLNTGHLSMIWTKRKPRPMGSRHCKASPSLHPRVLSP